MKKNLFDTIRHSVSALSAAELYGLHPNKYGKALCPFHNDHRPSMQLYPEDRGFYCFTCHASGSVIDLVAQIFGISISEASRKLCQDFGIPYNNSNYQKIVHIKKPRLSPENAYNQKLQHYTKIMLTYLLRLEKWLNYGPRTPEEEMNILFLEAIRFHDRVEYITETLLQGDPINRAEIIIYHEKELQKYEQRLRQITGRNAKSVPTGTAKN